MKAIFVESLNGYLARDDKDNMAWTPVLDKKIYKLLTYAFGGTCICSQLTYNLLPKKMIQDSNRKFIIAERNGPNSLTSLSQLYPNGVLIGGPTFLMAAYNLGIIDTFIITTINININSTNKYRNPFRTILSAPNCKIQLPDMTISIFNDINNKQK